MATHRLQKGPETIEYFPTITHRLKIHTITVTSKLTTMLIGYRNNYKKKKVIWK